MNTVFQRKEATAVDPFVWSLNASPCSLNLNKESVKEMDKYYLSLLLLSFQIDPTNNGWAA